MRKRLIIAYAVLAPIFMLFQDKAPISNAPQESIQEKKEPDSGDVKNKQTPAERSAREASYTLYAALGASLLTGVLRYWRLGWQ